MPDNETKDIEFETIRKAYGSTDSRYFRKALRLNYLSLLGLEFSAWGYVLRFLSRELFTNFPFLALAQQP